jgi:hypothetical protein
MVIRSASGTPITLSTTVTGTPNYNLYFVVELVDN